MKRRPTPKTLRAGQTIFFPAIDWHSGQHVVSSVTVGSDKLPEPEPHVIHDVLPRYYIIESMRDRYWNPANHSYSRREVASWIKKHGRKGWKA